MPIIAMLGLLAVAAVAIALLGKEAADRTQRGTGTGTVKPEPGTRVVSVKRTSANDFDPLGDDAEEHPDEAPLAVDQDPDTSWTTENYLNNTLTKPNGDPPGVGLYVDAEPSVNGKRLQIQTPEPGWTMEIYGTRSEPPDTWPSDLWTQLGGGTVEREKQTFKLDSGDRQYRYYLVWITALPPDAQRVEIGEIALFDRR